MPETRNSSQTPTKGGDAQGLAKRVVLRILEKFQEGFLEVVSGEHTYTGGEPGSELSAVMVIHNERFFSRVVSRGEVGIGESYMDGDWSTPDLPAVLRVGARNLARLQHSNRMVSMLSRWGMRVRHALHDNTLRGSRRNIHAHYDLSNDLFRLFLDPAMAYSSAYFETPEDTLERAQRNKFDRICRKLMLTPNDHLVEVGTGWGGLALHAARQYGCRVTTTTISHQQFEYARELFLQAGLLGSRMEIIEEDYRNLTGQYDKLVSVEMFEAVGLPHYDEFFAACDRVLRPDGAMLLQTITVPDQRFDEYRRNVDWIQTYIFPGVECPAVGEILRSVARCTRMELHHAEEIGQHYARTLAGWREQFLAAAPKVRALGFDERFIRMWEYYLAICEASFRERTLGDYQLLFAKLGTRKAVYTDRPFGALASSVPPSHLEPAPPLPNAD
jgi:cyclopropane-fatty-acyl-phospholipid synthase